MKTATKKPRVGSETWFKAVQRMFARARGKNRDIIGWNVRSLNLCVTSQFLGLGPARSRTMWKDASRTLTALMVERGYWPPSR